MNRQYIDTTEFTEGFVKECFDKGFSAEQTTDLLESIRLMDAEPVMHKAAKGFSGAQVNDYFPAYLPRSARTGGSSSMGAVGPMGPSDIYSIPKAMQSGGATGSGPSPVRGINTSRLPAYGPAYGFTESKRSVKNLDNRVNFLQKKLEDTLYNPAYSSSSKRLQVYELQQQIKALNRQRGSHLKNMQGASRDMVRDQEKMWGSAVSDMSRAAAGRGQADSRFNASMWLRQTQDDPFRSYPSLFMSPIASLLNARGLTRHYAEASDMHNMIGNNAARSLNNNFHNMVTR